MDFALSDEHADFQKTLRAFFEKEAPHEIVSDLDQREEYPADLYRKMADLGLCGIDIDEEYGGAGPDFLAACIVAEEMSRASAALVYAFVPTVTFAAQCIARYGTEEQKQDYLPRIVSGQIRFAMGLSEPGAGSDLRGLSTKAIRDGDELIISGQKIFTTGADTADYILTFVRTEAAGPGPDPLSVVIVPRTAPGVATHSLKKLAGQATHTCEVFLDSVRVPAQNLIGEPGAGVGMIFSLLDRERVLAGAQAVGIAQGAFDLALRYSQEREQFDTPIIDFQAVGHQIADMAMEIEASRLLTWSAAWRVEKDLPCATQASMAKVFASEAATRCASRGMQVLGGYSYMVEFGMERFYRESKLYEIAGGTNQIQRNIIVKNLRNPRHAH